MCTKKPFRYPQIYKKYLQWNNVDKKRAKEHFLVAAKCVNTLKFL